MKNSILIILTSLFAVSCTSQNEIQQQTQELRNQASWKTNNYIDSVQILLTNDYQIGQSFGFGASSFLILAKGDTVLCTAKHLLGEAMGIHPEIKTNKFNSKFGYWKAFARNGLITSDTVKVTKMITEKQDESDLILMDCENTNLNAFTVLKPRFTKAREGERLEIIGCTYEDTDCHQRSYFATVDGYEGGQLYLKSESKFAPSGFSGAPVIDVNGFVIGILSGGGEFEGALYLVIEPLSKIEDYLK